MPKLLLLEWNSILMIQTGRYYIYPSQYRIIEQKSLHKFRKKNYVLDPSKHRNERAMPAANAQTYSGQIHETAAKIPTFSSHQQARFCQVAHKHPNVIWIFRLLFIPPWRRLHDRLAHRKRRGT
jgi:hypothetical protein